MVGSRPWESCEALVVGEVASIGRKKHWDLYNRIEWTCQWEFESDVVGFHRIYSDLIMMGFSCLSG